MKKLLVLALALAAVLPAWAQNKLKVFESAVQIGPKTSAQVARTAQKMTQVTKTVAQAAQRAAADAALEMQIKDMQERWKGKMPSNVVPPEAPISSVLKKQAFYNAFMDGKLDIAQKLLDQNGKKQLISDDVYFLCANLLRRPGHEKQIAFLLENGLNPNKVLLNIPLIHHAVLYEGRDYLPILKKYGADLNIQSGISKATPLHWAIYNYATTKELIKLGADPTIPNADGRTPAQLARKVLNEAIATEKGLYYPTQVAKVVNFYEAAPFYELGTFSVWVQNGEKVVSQTARIIPLAQARKTIILKERVYVPDGFSVIDAFHYYKGLQVDALIQLKDILSDRVSLLSLDELPEALFKAFSHPQNMDVKELALPVIAQVKIPVLPLLQHSYVVAVMAFLEINGQPGWYRVTLQENGQLLFTPVPMAVASGYFFR